MLKLGKPIVLSEADNHGDNGEKNQRVDKEKPL
jgi:hypothetical protein